MNLNTRQVHLQVQRRTQPAPKHLRTGVRVNNQNLAQSGSAAWFLRGERAYTTDWAGGILFDAGGNIWRGHRDMDPRPSSIEAKFKDYSTRISKKQTF
jgi:hypothetical protein